MLADNILSDVLGGISIGCWVVVYSPQILENFQLKSGEGLSVVFVVIWLLGDLFNLVGGVLGNLLPTVIILAIYYSVCDIILLFQIYYYRWAAKQQSSDSCTIDEVTEASLLLNRNVEGHVVKNRTSPLRVLAQYAAAIVIVFASGIISWWIGIHQHHDGDTPETLPAPGTSEWIIQVFGWTSAVLYLGARVPQIFKNFTTRCEGLAPALFIFAIGGNAAYSLSILAASMKREYVIRNASWLAGSALTIFLDVFVLCQFFFYRAKGSREREDDAIDES